MDDSRYDRDASPEARAYYGQTRAFAVAEQGSDLDPGGLVGGKLDITGIVRRTFEALAVEAPSLAGIGLLVYSPLIVFFGILLVRVVSGLTDPFDAQTNGALVATMANVLLVQIVSAGAIVLIFARFRGEQIAIGAAVKEALSRIFGLLGLGILVGISVFAGLIACIVPGLILQAALSLAVPALMVERLRVGAAYSRSFDLTRGHRWPIFVVMFFFSLVGGILGAAESVGLKAMIPDPTTYTLVYLPLSLLTTVVLGVLNGVSLVLIYHDLRIGKEGLDEDELVAAFE